MMKDNLAYMRADVRAEAPADTAGADNMGEVQRSEFLLDLKEGLARQRKSISPKYFYDAAGSALFDQICALPEYYPTRTELSILQRHAREIALHLGPHAEILEFGAGVHAQSPHAAGCDGQARALYPHRHLRGAHA